MLKQIHDLLYKESKYENEATRYLALQRLMYIIMFFYYIHFIWVVYRNIRRISNGAVLFLALSIIALIGTYYLKKVQNITLFTLIQMGWIIWAVYTYGWNISAQLSVFALLVLVYFTFYDMLLQKLVFSGILFGIRFGLFYYCKSYAPRVFLSTRAEMTLQISGSLVLFVMLSCICGIYSSNIESAEKKLVLYNEKLKEQASTDPLTGLWNRRNMLQHMENFMKINSAANFSMVLCDIDFFKHINDTWGHNCGDDVLCWVADQMKTFFAARGSVCRWGGEEFLFFLPEINGEHAMAIVTDFKLTLDKSNFIWEDQEIKVTMTFGIEENDFRSDLKTLVSQVDQKMYMGKTQGRDRIIY